MVFVGCIYLFYFSVIIFNRMDISWWIYHGYMDISDCKWNSAQKWKTEHKTWHLLLVKYGAMLNFDVFLCYYLKNYVGIPPQEGSNHRIYNFSRMTTSENCWGDLTHFIHYWCICAWLFFVVYPIKWIWLQFSVFKWEA